MLAFKFYGIYFAFSGLDEIASGNQRISHQASMTLGALPILYAD